MAKVTKTPRRRVSDLSRFPSENPNPVLRVGIDGILVFSNPAGTALLNEWTLVPGEPAPSGIAEAVRNAVSMNDSVVIELPHADSVYSFSVAPVADSGYANVYGLDITARVRSEEAVRAALVERETLLRELNHRTKNNMNVISAMISLQASSFEDTAIRQVFADLERKIASMALVHQKLYETKSLSRIAFEDYVRDLFALFMHGHGRSGQEIELVFDLEPILVVVEVAIPCGLMLNELLTNSLKHAFPDDRSGLIKLTIQRVNGDAEIEIRYEDDGVGIPDDLDIHNQATLGIQTIIMIVEHQLRGVVTFGSGPGFRCTVQFPIPNHGPLEGIA